MRIRLQSSLVIKCDYRLNLQLNYVLRHDNFESGQSTAAVTSSEVLDDVFNLLIFPRKHYVESEYITIYNKIIQ